MNEEIWSDNYNYACQAMQENDLEQAEGYWRKAWEEVSSLPGNDPRYLMTLEYFCDLLCQKQKLDEAEPLMTDLLDCKKSVFGDEDIKVGTTHNSLAGLFFALRKFDEAKDHCESALTIHKQVLGEEHPDVVLIMQNLAMLYHAMEEFDKAEPLYEETMELAKRVHGPHSTLTLSIAENLVGLFNATGQKKKRNKTKKTLMLPVLERLVQVVGTEKEAVKTNKGFAGSTLTGLKRDPRRSNQCMYRIKPLPAPAPKDAD